MKKILLSIFTFLGLASFFVNNAYAEAPWVYFTSMDYQRRAFTVCNENGCNYYSNGQWNENGMPNVIIGQVPVPGRSLNLNGVTYQNNLSNAGNPNEKYNKLETILRFKQQDGRDGNIFYSNSWSNYYRPILNYQLSDNSTGQVQCVENGRDTVALEWRCEVATDNYKSFKSISIDYGSLQAGSQSPVIAQMCAVPGTCGENAHQNNPNSLILETWRYRVESSADPLVAGQNTIISQNQTIINQNQQIIDAQNQTNQWLQDTTPPNVDTSSLNTSVGWMPPGPVDSILTLPLQLLQGIVNVFTNTNCSPLQVPVPYVNETITLPCVSTLMDEIGFTPIWGIVGGIISAVIIWDTLKWLYKFVDDTLTFRENNSGIWGGL